MLFVAKSSVVAACVGLLLVVFLLVPTVAFAADSGLPSPGNSGLPQQTQSGQFTLKNPLGSTNDLVSFLRLILRYLTIIAIPILVVLFIWIGFKFVLAQGNPADIAKARQAFYWTVIGAALVLGADALLTVISGTVQQLRTGSIDSHQQIVRSK